MKTYFPEFQKFVAKDGSFGKRQGGVDKEVSEGLTVQVFKAKLREAMPRMGELMIERIVDKIDHLQGQIILWDDFLRFLESEGELRELINDMRITQPGTTRLKEQSRFKIRNCLGSAEPTTQDQGSKKVERMLVVDLHDDVFLLTCTESHDVELLQLESMRPAFAFRFQSDYAQPKPRAPKPLSSVLSL